MSTYGLARLFEPSSVALEGGSPRERSLGRKVLENLGSGGFAGPIFPVNPKHPEIGGMASAPNLSALPPPPDLVYHCSRRCAEPEQRRGSSPGGRNHFGNGKSHETAGAD
jgi:acetyltransferase